MQTPADAPVARAGLLRVLVLFHEAELLGAGTSVLNVVEPLGEYGWSVSGWLPGPGLLADVARKRLAAVTSAQRPLAVSVRGWREDPGVLARVRATPRYLAALRTALLELRPHVVHANTLRAIPEARVARRAGIPIVFHVHELPEPGGKRAAALAVAGRTADVLVGVSGAVSTLLRPYARGKPVLTAYNGVELGAFSPVDGVRPFTVGTVGTISRVKGTDLFLHAARLVAQKRPDVRFEVAGQRDQHRDSALDGEISSLLAAPPLREAASLLGRQEAGELLPRWDLFVLPSRMDAFPLATLEAMAAGVPVIAADVGGISEQITHLESGVLVSPENPGDVAEWIVRLHDDPGLRSRLAAAARARVMNEFTLERQAASLHRAYLLALNRRFGPPSVRAAAANAA